MERYVVGTISRPHGVRGAVKVDPLTDNVSRFKKLKEVFINNQKYTVINAQVSKTEVYLTFEEVKDRDSAESLRNKNVEIEKKDAVSLPKDRYFIVDIIGCKCIVDNNIVGEVKEVLQNGAADVYILKTDKKDVMVPALKKLLVSVDVESKEIIFDKQVFSEVAVYED